SWQPQTQKYLKSPLNYIGGKYKLLNQIIPLFPDNIDTFVDLFSGGANVGINVPAKRYIFNDMNNKINEMFRYFNNHEAEDLIAKIKSRIHE
ncbi:DNA adenine methylase, partial [Enterococcus faecalis]